MADPQIIVLSGLRTHAHDAAWYERRRGTSIEPRMRDHAAEAAPGVWVGLLAFGDHYCQEHGHASGAVIAVWIERPGVAGAAIPDPGDAEAAVADIPEAAIRAASARLYGLLADFAPASALALHAMTADVLTAAAPHMAAAERKRLYAELGNDHWVIFTEDGWTTEHSVECRLSGQMSSCAWHEAVRRIAHGFDPGMAGRWLITAIDPNGEPALVRADLTGEDSGG